MGICELVYEEEGGERSPLSVLRSPVMQHERQSNEKTCLSQKTPPSLIGSCHVVGQRGLVGGTSSLCSCFKSLYCDKVPVCFFLYSNHNGATPLVLAKRRGVNRDALRLLEGLEEQEVKGFNRSSHSSLEKMHIADNER